MGKALGYEIRARGTSTPVRMLANGQIVFSGAATIFRRRGDALVASMALMRTGVSRQLAPYVVPVYEAPPVLPKIKRREEGA